MAESNADGEVANNDRRLSGAGIFNPIKDAQMSGQA